MQKSGYRFRNGPPITTSLVHRSLTGYRLNPMQLKHSLILRMCSPTGMNMVSADDIPPAQNIVGFEGDTWIPTCVQFAKTREKGHLLVVLTEGGKCTLLDTAEYEVTGCISSWTAHRNCAFDAEWFDQDTKLVTASGDMTAVVWDLEMRRPAQILMGHQGTLKTVSCNPVNPALLATGGRDGSICFWDTRANPNGLKISPVQTISNAHEMPRTPGTRKRQRVYGKPVHSVTCALFSLDGQQIFTAGIEGKIKLWDTRKLESMTQKARLKRKRKCCPVFVLDDSENNRRPHGITSLCLSSDGTRLLSSSTASRLCLYNWTLPEMPLLNTYRGHQNASLYPKASFSNDDNYIASGSCDHSVYIWKVASSGLPFAALKGHHNESTCVDWNKAHFAKLASCSDDLSVRVWSVPENADSEDHTCHRCPNSPEEEPYGFGHAHTLSEVSINNVEPSFQNAPLSESLYHHQSEQQQSTILHFLGS